MKLAVVCYSHSTKLKLNQIGLWTDKVKEFI